MADLTAAEHAAIRHAIAWLQARQRVLVDWQAKMEAVHLDALRGLLGRAVGKGPENTDPDGIPTAVERRERRGALDDAPAIFPVETARDRDRAARIIEAHRDAPVASHLGQTVTALIALVNAYDDTHDEAVHPDPEEAIDG